MKHRKIMGLVFAIVAFLFVMLSVQLQTYRAQEKELQKTLAEQTKALDACGMERQDLQTRLTALSSLEESDTETGFVKKGGIYLIDTSHQLETLRDMIQADEEIEPGIPAAEASYRLRNSVEVHMNWFSIGTEETPFCGQFDGDGHYVNAMLSKPGNDVNAMFVTGASAEIENLNITNALNQSPDDEVLLWIDSEEECAQTVEHLSVFPDCRVALEIYNDTLDTQELADTLQARWERNQDRDGYYVSVFFRGEDDQAKEDAMKPFHRLVREDWKQIVTDAVAHENGYLRFIRLEHIAGIQCCTFDIGDLDNRIRNRNEGFHIILEGRWEGTDVPTQHLYIPYTEMEQANLGQAYDIERVDINFDGAPDLLIQEGYSGGSGGSWGNYRALIWDSESGQFVYYPSFPEQIAFLDFDRQRVINRGQVGVGYQYVCVYGVVNGEYACTEELIYESKYSEETKQWGETLSYYKMGELVRTHDLTGLAQDEWEQLYPDLDYWLKG